MWFPISLSFLFICQVYQIFSFSTSIPSVIVHYAKYNSISYRNRFSAIIFVQCHKHTFGTFNLISLSVSFSFIELNSRKRKYIQKKKNVYTTEGFCQKSASYEFVEFQVIKKKFGKKSVSQQKFYSSFRPLGSCIKLIAMIQFIIRFDRRKKDSIE